MRRAVFTGLYWLMPRRCGCTTSGVAFVRTPRAHERSEVHRRRFGSHLCLAKRAPGNKGSEIQLRISEPSPALVGVPPA